MNKNAKVAGLPGRAFFLTASLSLLLANSFLSPQAPAAYAVDQSGAAGTAAAGSGNPATGGAGSSPAATASPASTPIQGGVQVIELNLERLRDLGLDIKNIVKASSSLYDEVTIQPVTIQTAPSVVGPGTIINIPIGFTPVGPAPQPKKQRVDMAMNQMRPIIQVLKQDSDEFEEGKRRLDISEDELQDLHPWFEDWRRLIDDINAKLITLEGMTKSPPYDNSSIAGTAQAIHADAKKMDDVRRKVYKYLQKQGKKKKKNA